MLHFWVRMFEKLLLAVLLAASLAGFWWRFGAVLRKIRAAKPDADFSLRPDRPADSRTGLGSDAPGQGHPRAASARPGPRLRVLGILRLRAGHAESHRDRIRDRVSDSRQFLLPTGGRVRGSGGDLDRGTLRPPVHPAPEVAGRAVVPIRRDRAADLRADGDVPGRVLGRRFETVVVVAHRGAADLSSPDPAHQASAPGPQPVFDFPLARRLRQNSAPGRRRRRFRPRHRQGPDADRRAAGVLLRRVRPLHRTLSRQQHRQDSRSQRRSPWACATT